MAQLTLLAHVTAPDIETGRPDTAANPVQFGPNPDSRVAAWNAGTVKDVACWRPERSRAERTSRVLYWVLILTHGIWGVLGDVLVLL